VQKASPRVPTGEKKKSEIVNIRLTIEQKKLMQKKADAEGLRLADWMRKTCLATAAGRASLSE